MPKLSQTPFNLKGTIESMGYCPYMDISDIKSNKGSYTTLTEGLIVPEKRSINANTSIPDSLANGGLYGGMQSTGNWANIPVIPTDTNMIHYNLRSANPPPGATEQYVGTDRPGNNYAPMIGIYWYNPESSNGLYKMMVMK